MNEVRCCIAGCGPAGAMLGLLLARAGVQVVVLEKHADFLRDFRGDTLHPSTLEILDELGLADRLLSELPHSEVRRLEFRLPTDGQTRQHGGSGPCGPEIFSLKEKQNWHVAIDFGRLPTRFKFIAFVPQWDFLEFVTREACRYPSFTLIREAEVEDLLIEGGRVVGVRYRSADGAHEEVRALLTVGADGRTSRVREVARLPLIETSPPMDVLWFRVSRRSNDSDSVELVLSRGHFFGLINRREYWQVAYVIPKGAFEQVRGAGLEAFRTSFAEGVPELADRAQEITDWDQVKLLTVRADRLRRWYRDGLLCIGDAAHAMSPVAGVGINVAVQDAVEAANLLWSPLRRGEISVADLARVQRRRELPVRLTQAVQGWLQERILRPTLGSRTGLPTLLPAAELALRVPRVMDLPARFIGLGFRRPQVRTPALS